MALTGAILAEIDQEARATRAILERVPDDKLNWAPHPKSMTLGKLAWHIATLPVNVGTMLREGEFDLAKAGRPPQAESAADIVAAFTRHLEEIKAYLAAIDDTALRAPFTLRRGDQTLRTITKLGVVRAILLNHTYHHRGQLSVYLRLLDVPIPSIYGPSADEPA